jgi:hypothetical protein
VPLGIEIPSVGIAAAQVSTPPIKYRKGTGNRSGARRNERGGSAEPYDFDPRNVNAIRGRRNPPRKIRQESQLFPIFRYIYLWPRFARQVGEETAMSLIEKIPTMSDEDVANLLANARRLSETGTPQQRASAEELLPALEESAGARATAKAEAAAAKRAATRKPRKAVAA